MLLLMIISVVIVLVLVGQWFQYIYRRQTKLIKRDLTGKTVIITGATSGIGYETALTLSSWGAKVIVGCRDLAVGQQLFNRYHNIEVQPLDLTSFASVRSFANTFIQLNRHCDILILNAGVVMTQYKLTQDAYETTYQTNHLSHFLLTGLLMPVIKGDRRIVVVASDGARYVNTEQCLANHDFGFGFEQYLRTKLMNFLFTIECHRRYSAAGIVINVLHPGPVASNISRNASKYLKPLIKLFVILGYLKSTQQGAATTIYVATSSECNQGGQYFYDCHRAPLPEKYRNINLTRRLWDISQQATKINY